MQMIELMGGYPTPISREERQLINKLTGCVVDREDLSEREMTVADQLVSRGIIDRTIEYLDKITYTYTDPTAQGRSDAS